MRNSACFLSINEMFICDTNPMIAIPCWSECPLVYMLFWNSSSMSKINSIKNYWATRRNRTYSLVNVVAFLYWMNCISTVHKNKLFLHLQLQCWLFLQSTKMLPFSVDTCRSLWYVKWVTNHMYRYCMTCYGVIVPRHICIKEIAKHLHQ